jgi:hypothetical protein
VTSHKTLILMLNGIVYFITSNLHSAPLERKGSGIFAHFILCRLSCDKMENYCFKLMMKYGSVFERIDYALRFCVGAMWSSSGEREADVKLRVFALKECHSLGRLSHLQNERLLIREVR